ncbi:hypothetical protein HaLaN_16302 [Haematococcus lacustris]|uniref:Ig-like domain-containing protein n=1 Tax=Haematococcus lacustris TaxID=44745 RepID=A0A699ZKN3_HAELA|nr:hypothetical protein HaLaN_16302 [Haematococcus lacustris]
MWCPVVAPRKPPQAPRNSQPGTPPAASKPGPRTPPPAKRIEADALGRAGDARLSCAGGQIRQLCQSRARSTLAWVTSGYKTSHPRPSSSSSLLRHRTPSQSDKSVGGRHSCTMSMCIGFTPHSPLTPAILAQGGAAHQREASGLLGLMCTFAGAGEGVGNSGRVVPGLACLVGL